MSRKALGIAIVIIGAIMLAGFAYFLFFSQTSFINTVAKYIGGSEPVAQPATPVNGPNATKTEEIKRIIAEENQTAKPVEQRSEQKPVDMAKDSVGRMAASFAERFGSYSNQSNFSNIIDLKIFMSYRMQAWADEYVREQRLEKTPNDIYFGITTKAIAQEVRRYDDHIGQAEVLVSTRRREAVNSTSNVSNVFNQNIVITLIQEKGAWKVDAASWQDKL